uniref:Uncharacterized protein n=1 Tax=Tetranychus urticae TaxID=32264 RepID=T1KQI5_TETUR
MQKQQINSRPGANGATIEVVQEKEQPARSKDVGRDTEQQSGNIQESSTTDANPQTKRARGRPRKVAPANGTIIEKVKRTKNHIQQVVKDVGRDTEQQSGNILDSQENFDNSPLALLYALAKKISSVMRELTVKGPLIIPPELCQKEKIERMDLVLNNEIKKSFYYTIIDRKGELWEREEIDRVLRYKCSIGIGENYKNFCSTLKGCKLENGKCRINVKSDHVLNHIRGQLGFRFDCFYCEGCRTANIKHFKKHYLQFHWTRGFDPVQLSEAETVNDST